MNTALLRLHAFTGPLLLAAAQLTPLVTTPDCKALTAALGNKVSYPADEAYSQSLASYWSQQEEQLAPDCVITPTSTQDVASIIKTLISLNAANNSEATFALRGGGHTPYVGSANINKGVTIDMRSIKGVEVSADQKLTSIGGGAIWRDVYQELAAMNLMVSGGRVSNIGVGGLTVGGGISFFSPRKGFVCDNVENFEVVLANGKIVNANNRENSDLWIALRGGSSNFGIVTRFDMRTFSQGNIWGGIIRYDISTAPQQLEAFANFNVANDYDENAELIQNYAFVGERNLFLAINSLEYTQPTANPQVFQAFTTIQRQLSNSMRVTNLVDITDEQAALSGNGARQIFMTTTFKNDISILTSAFQLWRTSTSTVSQVAGITYALTFHVLPPAITSKSAPLGGNSMGLDPSDGPLVICLLTMTWNSVTNDATVSQTGRELIREIDRVSKSKGLHHRFKYLNYADYDQEPFEGYGPQNQAQLQAVSRHYDSRGLFQRAMPGGFKVF